MGKHHSNYNWKPDKRQVPSRYQFSIDGETVTFFLATKHEAAGTGLYAYIYKMTGLFVRVVGVAAGDGAAAYPYDMEVIEAPMYHEGNIRVEGIEALWAKCKVASRDPKSAILGHCVGSFHRAPLLLAAMMVKSGMTFGEAMEYIASERRIYGGHFLDPSMWPQNERKGRKSQQLLAAQNFVRGLEKGRRARPSYGLQPEAAASERKAESGQKAPRQNVKEKHAY